MSNCWAIATPATSGWSTPAPPASAWLVPGEPASDWTTALVPPPCAHIAAAWDDGFMFDDATGWADWPPAWYPWLPAHIDKIVAPDTLGLEAGGALLLENGLRLVLEAA